MNKHLQTLVGAEVERGVAIHTTSLTGLQLLHLHLHGLLIQLGDLRLSRIDNSAHARRENVVHRLTSGILFNIHRVDCNRPLCWLIGAHIWVIVVVAPFASHEFKCSETQVGGLLEIRHKHSYETNGREVVD